MINVYPDTGKVTAVCDECGREWLHGKANESAASLLERALTSINAWSGDGVTLLGPICSARARRNAEVAPMFGPDDADER